MSTYRARIIKKVLLVPLVLFLCGIAAVVFLSVFGRDIPDRIYMTLAVGAYGAFGLAFLVLCGCLVLWKSIRTVDDPHEIKRIAVAGVTQTLFWVSCMSTTVACVVYTKHRPGEAPNWTAVEALIGVAAVTGLLSGIVRALGKDKHPKPVVDERRGGGRVALGPDAIPPEFPSRIAPYPGADYASTTRTAEGVVIALATADPVEAVLGFYRKQPGYQHVSEVQVADQRVLCLKDVSSGKDFQVNVKTQGHPRQVLLVFPFKDESEKRHALGLEAILHEFPPGVALYAGAEQLTMVRTTSNVTIILATPDPVDAVLGFYRKQPDYQETSEEAQTDGKRILFLKHAPSGRELRILVEIEGRPRHVFLMTPLSGGS
jgi:hypothetical protein